jgi:hypothetical protein
MKQKNFLAKTMTSTHYTVSGLDCMLFQTSDVCFVKQQCQSAPPRTPTKMFHHGGTTQPSTMTDINEAPEEQLMRHFADQKIREHTVHLLSTPGATGGKKQMDPMVISIAIEALNCPCQHGANGENIYGARLRLSDPGGCGDKQKIKNQQNTRKKETQNHTNHQQTQLLETPKAGEQGTRRRNHAHLF